MKQLFLASLLGSTIAMCTAAMAADDLKTLEAAAKAEGAVNSVGMPDDWANWKGTWDDLAKTYGLKHIDTDMSSAQEIAKFAAEKITPARTSVTSVQLSGRSRSSKAWCNRINQRPGTRCRTGPRTRMATGRWPTPELSPSSSTRSCCTVPKHRPSGPISRTASTKSPLATSALRPRRPTVSWLPHWPTG